MKIEYIIYYLMKIEVGGKFFKKYIRVEFSKFPPTMILRVCPIFCSLLG